MLCDRICLSLCTWVDSSASGWGIKHDAPYLLPGHLCHWFCDFGSNVSSFASQNMKCTWSSERRNNGNNFSNKEYSNQTWSSSVFSFTCLLRTPIHAFQRGTGRSFLWQVFLSCMRCQRRIRLWREPTRKRSQLVKYAMEKICQHKLPREHGWGTAKRSHLQSYQGDILLS